MSCATPSCYQYDASIHQGAVGPYALRYTVTSNDPAFDLSTATAGSFSVKRENGGVDTWAGAVEPGATPSALTLTLTRIFQSGDLPDLEILTVVPILATPSGSFYGEPKRLRVRPAFE